ncbi:MAG: hypothetical protein DMF24_02845 [Verrucomicrobia bacterium]|nr:MAG: hypothetical protein DME90_09750 [Verrucomicrobiota bacterium]PYL62758.1 MAG: hypothetical protein DMF24_02845 [Verrucomicrobiota bacterium]
MKLGCVATVNRDGRTPAGIAGRYNNFYEFTTDKAAVARLASALTIVFDHRNMIRQQTHGQAL